MTQIEQYVKKHKLRYKTYFQLKKVLNELGLKVNSNTYLYPYKIDLENMAEWIRSEIEVVLGSERFISVQNFLNNSIPPNSSHELWNIHFIYSIYQKVNLKQFQLLVVDSSPLEGVIVSASPRFNQLSDFIISFIKSIGIVEFSEFDLLDFLKKEKIVKKEIPQEFFDNRKLRYSSKQFTIID